MKIWKRTSQVVVLSVETNDILFSNIAVNIAPKRIARVHLVVPVGLVKPVRAASCVKKGEKRLNLLIRKYSTNGEKQGEEEKHPAHSLNKRLPTSTIFLISDESRLFFFIAQCCIRQVTGLLTRRKLERIRQPVEGLPVRGTFWLLSTLSSEEEKWPS